MEQSDPREGVATHGRERNGINSELPSRSRMAPEPPALTHDAVRALSDPIQLLKLLHAAAPSQLKAKSRVQAAPPRGLLSGDPLPAPNPLTPPGTAALTRSAAGISKKPSPRSRRSRRGSSSGSAGADPAWVAPASAAAMFAQTSPALRTRGTVLPQAPPTRIKPLATVAREGPIATLSQHSPAPTRPLLSRPRPSRDTPRIFSAAHVTSPLPAAASLSRDSARAPRKRRRHPEAAAGRMDGTGGLGGTGASRGGWGGS